MNTCRWLRLPSSTFGSGPERSIRISVAASLGRMVSDELSRSSSFRRRMNSFMRAMRSAIGSLIVAASSLAFHRG
jgi:hypothetical protein